ncbi:hypothetical protein CN934_13880 [Ensifer sp. MMN_5]|nr:hypothetical protein CN934_13880 [Ensifer sp. MMN_5]PND28299.1 hypothetical protein CN933_09465 [Sinorhizobium sp. M4_45]
MLLALTSMRAKKKAAQSDRDLGQLIRKLAIKVKAVFPCAVKEDEANSDSYQCGIIIPHFNGAESNRSPSHARSNRDLLPSLSRRRERPAVCRV